MRIIRYYLAKQGSLHIKNNAAIKILADKHAELFPESVRFVISKSSVSRILRGLEYKTRSETKEEIKISIADILQIGANELDTNLDILEEEKSVSFTLSKLEKNNSITSINDLNKETVESLRGVWEQINVSTVRYTNNNNLDDIDIRVSLRFIYIENNKLLSRAIGVSTDWKGEINRIGQFVYISEVMPNIPYSEKAQYVYKFPELINNEFEKNKLISEGNMLIVVRAEGRLTNHIFSGKTILRKVSHLTKKYLKTGIKEFINDHQDLKDKYCSRVSVEEFERKSNYKQDYDWIVDLLRRDKNDKSKGFAFSIT